MDLFNTLEQAAKNKKKTVHVTAVWYVNNHVILIQLFFFFKFFSKIKAAFDLIVIIESYLAPYREPRE